MFARGPGPGFRGFPGPGMPGRGFGPRGFGPQFFPGGGILFLLVALVVLGVMVFALWHVFRKAGFEGALSLLALIPFVGLPAVVLFLGFAEWPALRVAAPAVPTAPVAAPEPVIVPTAPMTPPGEPAAPASEAPTVPIEPPKGPREPKGE